MRVPRLAVPWTASSPMGMAGKHGVSSGDFHNLRVWRLSLKGTRATLCRPTARTGGLSFHESRFRTKPGSLPPRTCCARRAVARVYSVLAWAGVGQGLVIGPQLEPASVPTANLIPRHPRPRQKPRHRSFCTPAGGTRSSVRAVRACGNPD